LERNETLLKDQSFPWNVLNCKEKLSGQESIEDAEIVSIRFLVFSQNMASSLLN
jgi:hypothetical protein